MQSTELKDIIIGDEHCTGKFLDMYKKNKDRTDIRYFVCVGDYFDPYMEVTNEDLLANFASIIDIAKADPRVKLLLGNHDIHYLVRCDNSRYNWSAAPDIKKALNDNLDLLSLVIDLGNNTIVSHAGVTKVWLDSCKLKLEEVNDILKSETSISRYLTYDERDYSGYGESPYQSCVWVRPNGLEREALSGYTQIVGHTRVENISYFINADSCTDSSMPYHKGNFYFVDTGDNYSYLELNTAQGTSNVG